MSLVLKKEIWPHASYGVLCFSFINHGKSMGFKPGSKTSSYSGPHHFKNIYEKLKKACAHSLYTHPFNLYSYMT